MSGLSAAKGIAPRMDVFATERDFCLPFGFQDADGTLHREGTMRLATASDEILPHKDPRVQQNPAYLVIIVLSRVITRLGELTSINPKVIEELYAADLAYLQDLYNELNRLDVQSALRCPSCDHEFRAHGDSPAGGF